MIHLPGLLSHKSFIEVFARFIFFVQRPLIVLFILISVLLFSSSVYAAKATHGVGFELGNLSGVSYKAWLNKKKAIHSTVGWDSSGGAVIVKADYLFHKIGIYPLEKGKLSLFYGTGFSANFEIDMVLTLRAPIGLTYEFEKKPYDIYFNYTPGLSFLPGFKLGQAYGLGFLYWLEE